MAREGEVASLCTWRSNRQMAVHQGACVRALGGRLLPTYFLAIRDPSCIKVRSVDQPVRQNGVRYVSLIFERDRFIHQDDAASHLAVRSDADAAFIITVSLPVAREKEFSKLVLPAQTEDWTDLFERLCSLGRER
jgi:hypothetical protein